MTVDWTVGSGNNPNASGTTLATGTFVLGGGSTPVTLSSPIPVISGNDYYLRFDPVVGSAESTFLPTYNSGYPDGDLWAISDPSSSLPPLAIDPSLDLGFTVEIQGAPPTLVPTLSEWGLILLALTVVAMGVVVVWRKKYSVSTT